MKVILISYKITLSFVTIYGLKNLVGVYLLQIKTTEIV